LHNEIVQRVRGKEKIKSIKRGGRGGRNIGDRPEGRKKHVEWEMRGGGVVSTRPRPFVTPVCTLKPKRVKTTL
jgi:hypothetical protein